MANILIAWQDDGLDRLSTAADAVADGARTVSAADIRRHPLETVDIDQLRWCDGFVIGVHSDPIRVADTLERWRERLGPHFWEAVQGTFAAVFVTAPEEARKRVRAHDRAVRLLAAHGMLVTGFAGMWTNAYAGVESPRGHFYREYERLGRLLAGMVCAWTDQSGDPRRKRILGSLVRATRRIPAMRPGAAGVEPAASRYRISDIGDGRWHGAEWTTRINDRRQLDPGHRQNPSGRSEQLR